jgi:hypothetical protein
MALEILIDLITKTNRLDGWRGSSGRVELALP